MAVYGRGESYGSNLQIKYIWGFARKVDIFGEYSTAYVHVLLNFNAHSEC